MVTGTLLSWTVSERPGVVRTMATLPSLLVAGCLGSWPGRAWHTAGGAVGLPLAAGRRLQCCWKPTLGWTPAMPSGCAGCRQAGLLVWRVACHVQMEDVNAAFVTSQDSEDDHGPGEAGGRAHQVLQEVHRAPGAELVRGGPPAAVPHDRHSGRHQEEGSPTSRGPPWAFLAPAPRPRPASLFCSCG